MPTLAVDNFNIVCATVGGFVTIFGLVSYLLKEKFYLSEALISTLAGVVLSPHAANFIRPLEYANGDPIALETITLYFCRLVLGVQLVLAGVQLPSRYLRTEWKPLSMLLGPGMCFMWLSTSMLVWALVPHISFLLALAVGACVTPTDPVLSNSIVKGKFADKNIPVSLQKIIVAESGTNDGLGYPFLFLALYLFKYTHDGGLGQSGGGGNAIRLWVAETWSYTILLSVVYGAVVGWIAKDLLHWAERRHHVDRESFLVFAITLSLFILGTCGMIGTDDLLACFIAGNTFTWDDWFRVETMDDSLQPTIDMLLNVAVFMWFGAVCPWHQFVSNSVIPIYRLIPLGILVLLLRRLPIVMFFHKFTPNLVPQIESARGAFFTGYFGPIGVSAIFYLYVAVDFLRDITVDGQQRPDAAFLGEIITVVVWFLVICSIVGHGLSIPLAKLSLYLPRTLSTAISSERISQTFSMSREDRLLSGAFRRWRPTSERDPESPTAHDPPAMLARFIARFTKRVVHNVQARAGSIISNHDDRRESRSDQSSEDEPKNRRASISGPMDPRLIGRTIHDHPAQVNLADDRARRYEETSGPVREDFGFSGPQATPATPTSIGAGIATGSMPPQRMIRFPDEQLRGASAEPPAAVSAPPTIARPEFQSKKHDS